MTKTLKLTRRGWIKHLAVVQTMLEKLELIYSIPTYRSVIGPKDCEVDRRKKIAKKFLELRELLWETSAVSEKVLRELAAKNKSERGVLVLEELCVEPWNEFDSKDEIQERRKFDDAAKDLELRSRGLWDDTAPEIVEPEVVYPGGEGVDETQPPKPEEVDPRQQTFDLTVVGGGKEPPAIDPSRLVDYKMQQANDDTTKPDDEEE